MYKIVALQHTNIDFRDNEVPLTKMDGNSRAFRMKTQRLAATSARFIFFQMYNSFRLNEENFTKEKITGVVDRFLDNESLFEIIQSESDLITADFKELMQNPAFMKLLSNILINHFDNDFDYLKESMKKLKINTPEGGRVLYPLRHEKLNERIQSLPIFNNDKIDKKIIDKIESDILHKLVALLGDSRSEWDVEASRNLFDEIQNHILFLEYPESLSLRKLSQNSQRINDIIINAFSSNGIGIINEEVAIQSLREATYLIAR